MRRIGRSFCIGCHTLTVLPPLIITHPDALELFSHSCFTIRSLLLVIAVYLMLQGYRHSPQPLAIRMYLSYLLVHVYAAGGGGGGLSALTIVSPNSCVLFPTFSSPDSSSTALCIESRYIPLATSFYGYALGRIRGLPVSTVSPDVVVVKGGNWAPGASQREYVSDPFCVTPPALYGSIPIFLLLPHIP